MDEDVRQPIRPARWLAWAVAGLLTAGVGSAGTLGGRKDVADRRIVTAAGENMSGVEVPTTANGLVTPAEPPTIPPPAPVAPSTTTTVAPRTIPTAPPATQAPRTTTTKPPAPATTTPTTAAPVPAGTTLTVVNQHPLAVVVTVNGKTFQVASGQQVGPAAITRSASGNDVVEVAVAQEPTCGTGDADRYFSTAGSYRMIVAASPGLCQPGMPGPVISVTPA